MKGRMKYMSSAGWTAELLVVFVSGFVAATMLWLGLWFLQAKPAHAAALQAKETALQKCAAAKEQCTDLKGKIQGENEEINRKLEEALAGWGRCIRSKEEPKRDESGGVGGEEKG